MRMPRFPWAAALVVSLACGAPAASRNARTIPPEAVAQSGGAGPADSVVRVLYLGSDSITLEWRDSLPSIASRWHLVSDVRTEGSDPSLSVRAMCLHLVDGSREAYLILRSDSHMDYPVIHGFTLSATAPPGWTQDACADHPVNLQEVRTAHGLHLAMPWDSALAAVGAQNRPAPDSAEFQYHGTGVVDSTTATPAVPVGTPFEIGASLKLRNDRGRLSTITAWYIEGL